MSDAKKKKKSKKRKHADLGGEDYEGSLDLEEANDDAMYTHTERERKKKKKSKHEEQDLSRTLLISEDGDSTKYPFIFSPGTLTWMAFSTEVKEICDIQAKQIISMTFEQKLGGQTFNAHLKDKSYKIFEDYIRKSAADEPCMLDIHRGIKHLTSLKKNVVAAVSSTTKDPKDDSQASDSKAKTSEELLAAFQEKGWAADYVQSFALNIRENVLRTIVTRAACLTDCGKKECKGKHTMKTVALEKMELGFQKKSRRIFRRWEIRSFFEKRKAFKIVYGNECLLLNPLHAQCPICGSLVSLGHFNDVMQKSDKLDEHIRTSHYANPIRSSHRGT